MGCCGKVRSCSPIAHRRVGLMWIAILDRGTNFGHFECAWASSLRRFGERKCPHLSCAAIKAPVSRARMYASLQCSL